MSYDDRGPGAGSCWRAWRRAAGARLKRSCRYHLSIIINLSDRSVFVCLFTNKLNVVAVGCKTLVGQHRLYRVVGLQVGRFSAGAWSRRLTNGVVLKNELEGKRALVTGGAFGIGRAIAVHLASSGAEVTILTKSPDDFDTSTDIPDGWPVVVGDLTDDELYRERADDLSGFDIIVNNAGGNADKRPFGQETVDGWRETFEINVVAAMRLSLLNLPGMMERRWGRIVNIASIYGFLAHDPRNLPPTIGNGGYIASKHGVIGMTRYFAGQVGDSGVTVNAVSPGMITWKPSLGESHDDIRERLRSHTPLGRNGEPEDIAGAVGYLVTPGLSDWVTGQNLVVDGGWSIW